MLEQARGECGGDAHLDRTAIRGTLTPRPGTLALATRGTRPILNHEPRHALELLSVVGDERQSQPLACAAMNRSLAPIIVPPFSVFGLNLRVRESPHVQSDQVPPHKPERRESGAILSSLR